MTWVPSENQFEHNGDNGGNGKECR